MRRLLSVPVLVTALSSAVLLAGCGDATTDSTATGGTSTSPTSSPTSSPSDSASTSDAPSASGSSSSAAPALPACDSVWVDGHQLTLGYKGCVDGARTVTAQRQPCEMGKPLVTYRNKFWAAAGGPVHEVPTILAKDAGWHRALVQCGG